MKEFIQRNKEFPIIYLAVQGSKSEKQFYSKIYEKIIEQSRSRKVFGFLEKGWNKFAEMFPENKITKFGKLSGVSEEQIKKYLKYIFIKNDFILFIDEFPDFILKLKEKGTIEPFLSNFRDFKNECSKLKTVLTGSINLMRTVSKLGLSDLLNEYRTFDFPLFSKKDSMHLYECLLYSIDYTINDDEQEYIKPYVEDGIPLFIQYLADEIQKISPENKDITKDNLKAAINNFYKLDEFALRQFHERLEKYLKEENMEKPAKIILSHLSNDKLDFDTLYSYVNNFISKKQLDELLCRLQDEAYIKKEGDEYSFLSKLLAGWWNEKKHFERSE